MANKPTQADFSPSVPDFPSVGQFMPIYGKFDLTTYIQGASDYEIMSFLVQKYNATIEGYSEVTQLSKDTVKAYNQLQTWVNTWFDNLDVSEEINAKIDKMVDEGTFGELLHKTFDEQINTGTTNAVTAWLVANVTPTGSAVIVDKSLSISGAAADSKIVGDKFNVSLTYKGTISDISDRIPGIYYVNANTNGAPVNSAGILIISGTGTGIASECFYTIGNSEAYFRHCVRGAGWSTWARLDSNYLNNVVEWKGNISDVNSPSVAGVYFINANSSNAPFSVQGILVVFGADGVFFEMASAINSKETYYRTCTRSYFQQWTRMDTLGYKSIMSYLGTATNLNDLKDNGVYFVNSATENSPFTENAICLVQGIGTTFASQIITSLLGNITYIRSITGGATWREWRKVVTANDKRWFGKVASFLGDSIVEGRAGNFVNGVANYLDLSKANNYGIGGSRMASSERDAEYTPVCKIYDTIDESSDIIYVAAGTNDYSGQIPLGDETSTDITTFNGALNVTMQGLREKFPTKLIIFANILSRYTDSNDINPIKCNQYRECIKNRCEANHIIFYDSYKYSGFDFSNGENPLSADGLHPNQIGADILARKISGFINWQ